MLKAIKHYLREFHRELQVRSGLKLLANVGRHININGVNLGRVAEDALNFPDYTRSALHLIIAKAGFGLVIDGVDIGATARATLDRMSQDTYIPRYKPNEDCS